MTSSRSRAVDEANCRLDLREPCVNKQFLYFNRRTVHHQKQNISQAFRSLEGHNDVDQVDQDDVYINARSE